MEKNLKLDGCNLDGRLAHITSYYIQQYHAVRKRKKKLSKLLTENKGIH